MLFGASLVRRRKDLLNLTSFLVPKGFDFDSTECIQPDEMPCVLSELCSKYRGEEWGGVLGEGWGGGRRGTRGHFIIVSWS